MAAMFIARETPGTALEATERRALGVAFDLIQTTRPHLFRDETTFMQSPSEWAAIEDSVRASAAHHPHSLRTVWIEGKRDMFFDPSRRDMAWQLYSDHHPQVQVVANLAGAVHRGDVDEVRRLVFTPETDREAGLSAAYPELEQVKETLSLLAGKLRLLHRHRNRAPTSRHVAQVLGLHHQQGTRLAISIMDKLGVAGFTDLWCRRLGLDEGELLRSRLWKRAMEGIASRPLRKRQQVAEDREEDTESVLAEYADRTHRAHSSRTPTADVHKD
jgi:hypothetical protein